MSQILVVLQLLAISLCVLPFGNTPGIHLGLYLFAIGIFLGCITLYFNRPGNFSVYPEIKDHAQLITTGIYRYIRHPMYTSLFIAMSGIVIYNDYFLNFLGLVLLAMVLISKSYKEEKLLLEKFPEYREYMTKTKRFIPCIF
ncbi:methyltransferase family protein [Candidatus Nitrosacidococcus tergens]|nr:isoprenylcysteine carboxylmethyltransferase family protein [Candidatus Nitrosacidococcus tergens]